MKTMLLPLLFLVCVSGVIGQPMTGPFTVYETDSSRAVRDLHVTVQGDSIAWLYFVDAESDQATSAIRSLHISLLHPDSPPVASTMFDGPERKWVEDIYSDGTLEPYVLFSIATDYSTSISYRTYLTGRSGSRIIYDGWWDVNGGNPYGTRFMNGRLSPCVGGGLVVAGLRQTMQRPEDHVMPLVQIIDVETWNVRWTCGPDSTAWWFNAKPFAVSVARDTVVLGVWSDDYPSRVFTMTPSAGAPESHVITCEPQTDYDLERTRGGRMLSIYGELNGGVNAVGVNQILSNGDCVGQSRLPSPSVTSPTVAFHPDYGFAMLIWQSARPLYLIRMDTIGVFAVPSGILGEASSGFTVQDAALHIANDGRVVACWVETNAATDASAIRVVTVGWRTSLGAEDRPMTSPSSFALAAYPNPFNPSTTLHFEITHAGTASLRIFDLLGREVASLVSGRQDAGSHDIVWNASRVSSGVYFARLETTDGVRVQKLLLMK